MNNYEFVLEVIKLYQSAREPKFVNQKISRGRSRSISSSVEDLFAHYLSGQIECDHIYINQPISIDGFKNLIYPDLVIVRDKRIIAFIDFKMDMGWKRDGLYDLCRKQYDRLKKARGKKCKLKEGVSKREYFYIIDKKATFAIVIFTDRNISPNLLMSQLQKSSELKPNLEVFVLTAQEHPNEYNISPEDLIQKMEIRDNEFKRLINRLR